MGKTEEYGLVLSGGGGKGAYEVGVWLAINDLMKSRDIKITGFSGASVGALNAALFACCSPQKTEEIWRHIHWSTVLDFNIREQNDKKQKVITDYIFSRAGLYQVIKDAEISEKISDVKVPVYAVCTYLPDKAIEKIKNVVIDAVKEKKGKVTTKKMPAKMLRGAKVKTKDVIPVGSASVTAMVAGSVISNVALEMGKIGVRHLLKWGEKKLLGEAKYFKCNKQPENVENILLASSAMPIAFKNQMIDGEVEFNEDMEKIREDMNGYYCDGGLKDNLPINCLIEDEDCNAKKLIVVHLGKTDKQHKKEKYNGIEMIHIFPSVRLYGIASTLNFSRETINDLIEAGYKDAKEQLFDYFSKTEKDNYTSGDEERHYANGEFYNSIAQIYEAKWYGKPIELGGKIVNKLKENGNIDKIVKQNQELITHREYRTRENKFVEFGISHEKLIENIIIGNKKVEKFENGQSLNCYQNNKIEGEEKCPVNIEVNNGNALSLTRNLSGKSLILNTVRCDNKKFYYSKKDKADYFLRSTLFESLSNKNETKKLDELCKKDGEEYIVITPNVIVFRDENLEKLDNIYSVGFGTIYCNIELNKSKVDINVKIKEYIRDYFRIASAMHYENIFIDGWGINELKCSSEDVAQIFYDILITERYSTLFKKIVFNFEDTIENIIIYNNVFKKYIKYEQYQKYDWLNGDLSVSKEKQVYAFDEDSRWSIFKERTFEINGEKFNSVFQYMQYKKALTYDDIHIASYILKTNDREKMRHYIKSDISPEKQNEKYWRAIKQNIMMEGIQAQLETYPELKEELIKTGEKNIVFCTKNEKEYGIIADVTDENLNNEKKWKGNNQLGYALMDIRQDLQ